MIIHFPVGSDSTLKREIVFLIDGSDDVRSKFSAIREFVANLVQTFDLDEGKDKVAIVQFSNNPELSFGLDAYKSKEDAIQHIARLKPKGGKPQYIGAALQFVKENVFVSKADKRLLQIIILLAGGRSRDSPRGPASALKNAEIIIFTVGSSMSNAAEMKAISSYVNSYYSVTDLKNINDVQQGLIKHLKEIRSRETEGEKYLPQWSALIF